jgi:hypothetical protein
LDEVRIARKVWMENFKIRKSIESVVNQWNGVKHLSSDLWFFWLIFTTRFVVCLMCNRANYL